MSASPMEHQPLDSTVTVAVPSMRNAATGRFNVGRRRLRLRMAMVLGTIALVVAFTQVRRWSGSGSAPDAPPPSSTSLRGGPQGTSVAPSYARLLGSEPEETFGAMNCTAKPDADLTLLGNIVGAGLCKDRTDDECLYCCTSFDETVGVPVYFLVMLYMFLGLAIICDDYFCESLDAISEALNLSEDVAGATFMAAGSSAPELFTAIVTVLITGGSEGLGTIVGSAIFNIMIIVGVTAMFAGQELKVWWYPLSRDCIVYLISILLMVWAVADKEVRSASSLTHTHTHTHIFRFVFPACAHVSHPTLLGAPVFLLTAVLLL